MKLKVKSYRLKSEKWRGVKLISAVIFVSLLLISGHAHAITINGADEIMANSSSQYTASGCNGTVSWHVTGTVASISSNGVLTTGSASCGAITVAAGCADGSIATKGVRVNGGQWRFQSSCGNYDSAFSTCPSEPCCVGIDRCWVSACTCSAINGNKKYETRYGFTCREGDTITCNYGCIDNAQCISSACSPCPNFNCCGSTPCYPSSWTIMGTKTYEWRCSSCTDNDHDGVTTCNGDCDDSNPNIKPGAPEICGDLKDNNCDGNVDEGCETCEVSVKVSPLAVWPQKTGGKTEADVIVTLSKPAPSGGCNINFNVEPVSYSGTHSHHNSDRPKGEITPNSISFSQGEIGAQSGKYKSSEVAGEEKIKAKVNDKDKGETIIQIKVPGFFELGAGDGYVLIGQTNTHPKNHYGTENTLSSLLDIADAYLEKEKGTLRINDISLEWGGAFDLCEKWDPSKTCTKYPKGGHKTHRVGKTVDVSNKTAEGEVVTERSLEQVVKKLKSNITILPEGNHFHLTFP